jgi:peptidoglycan/xylan/chitin deacetylase (PgdA/CDA1 family)
VSFSFDMDAETLLHIYFPDTAHNRLAMASRLRYGPEVAEPRIVDALARLGLRQTFFVPGWCLEQYPRAVRLILDHGHEIAHHGYLHEKVNQLSREEERSAFLRGLDAIVKTTGRRPSGFRAPSGAFSRHTLDLLAEEGFDYDASLAGHDIPYLVTNGRGTLVELPHDLHAGRLDAVRVPQGVRLTCCRSPRPSGRRRSSGRSSTPRGGTGPSGTRSGTPSCRGAWPAATRWWS